MSRRILCVADVRFPLERANGIQTIETCAALARRGHARQADRQARHGAPAAGPVRVLRGRGRAGTVDRARVRWPARPPCDASPSLAQALGRALAAGARRPRPDARPRLREPATCGRDGGGSAALVYESHGFAPTVSEARPAMLTGAGGCVGREAAPAVPARGTGLARRRRVRDDHEGAGGRTARSASARGRRSRSSPTARACAARRRGRSRRPASTPVVGYSGHLYPWKGVDLLLDALAELPGVRGSIIGGHPAEPDAARLQARSRELGLDSRVVFTGLVRAARGGRRGSRRPTSWCCRTRPPRCRPLHVAAEAVRVPRDGPADRRVGPPGVPRGADRSARTRVLFEPGIGRGAGARDPDGARRSARWPVAIARRRGRNGARLLLGPPGRAARRAVRATAAAARAATRRMTRL